jgi:sigma-B regulation protein RsbU (phosphoserine phosphatase)
MIGAGLDEYTWRSEAVLAAELAPDGTIVRANPALRALTARDPVGSPFAALLSEPQRGAFGRCIGDADAWVARTFAFEGDPARPATDRTLWLRRAGAAVLVVGEPAVGEQDRLVEKVLELNDDLVRTQRELVRERERLQLARAAAEAASTHIGHLEAITAAGLAHLRLDDVLEDVLQVIAGAVGADRAVVLMLDAVRGELVARAGYGVEDAVLRDVRVPLGVGVAGTVAAGGRARVIDDLSTTEVHSAYLREAARSMAAVPLILDGEVIGVLHVSSDAIAHFGERDLALLMPAAGRAAVAIGRAQLHEREANIAETLQRALLPDSLPSVEGFRLSARFTPGSEVQVGGDWYDALPLPSGRLALVIGDVAGKGVRAASLMGELRAAVRAYALDEEEPQRILGRVDRLVLRSRHMATALLAVVDPGSGDVSFASAGHPPPLRVRADGTAELLPGGRSTPLLAFQEVEPARATLEPGDRLVLYTDGLMERRGEPIDVSLERLVSVASGDRADDLDAAVDALLAGMLPPGGAVHDDTAVIALERR